MTMRRTILAGLAAALTVMLTACGGSDDASKAEPADDVTTSPSAAPTTTAEPEDVDPDELGGIVAGNPTDLTWRVPEVPASWKPITSGTGEQTWQVGDSTCAISLMQPAGLGTEPEPTQDQVLDKYADRTAKALGYQPTVGDRDTSMFPLVTASKDVTATSKVSRASLTGRDGVEGEIYAYRRGDFALVLNTLCGKGAFDAVNASDFQPFIQALAISAEY
jgi:hypothetical protein